MRKIMDRLISIIIVALVGVSILTACGQLGWVQNVLETPSPDTSNEETKNVDEIVLDEPEPSVPEESVNLNNLSAKETLELYISTVYENKIDDAVQLICDDSIYAYGHTKESIHEYLTAFIFRNNYEYKDVLLQNVFSRDGYEGFKTTVKVSENGVDKTIDEGIIYVGERNGDYKIILYGALHMTEVPPQKTNDALLYMYITHIVQLVDGYAIVVETVNNTDVDFQYGWVIPGDIILETDIDTYYITLKSGSKAESHRTYSDTYVFTGASGRILSLSITKVMSLDSHGLPGLRDDGETFVIYKAN